MSRKKSTIDLKTVADSAKQEVEKAKDDVNTPAEDEKRVKLTSREISFEVSYDAPDGTDYTSNLVSKVMDTDGRLAKARVVSSLTRGLNPDSMGQEDRFRIEALARLSIQLIEPDEWVLTFTGQDVELLIHINNILLEHETRYFRGNARKSQDDKIQARIRSTVTAFTEAES